MTVALAAGRSRYVIDLVMRWRRRAVPAALVAAAEDTKNPTTCLRPPVRAWSMFVRFCVRACTSTIPRPIGSSVPVSRHRVSSGHATSSLAPHRHPFISLSPPPGRNGFFSIHVLRRFPTDTIPFVCESSVIRCAANIARGFPVPRPTDCNLVQTCCVANFLLFLFYILIDNTYRIIVVAV